MENRNIFIFINIISQKEKLYLLYYIKINNCTEIGKHKTINYIKMYFNF